MNLAPALNITESVPGGKISVIRLYTKLRMLDVESEFPWKTVSLQKKFFGAKTKEKND